MNDECMTRRICEPLPGFMKRESVVSLVGSRRTESLVACPSSEAECRETLAFARRNGLSICPRGSGHSYGDLPLNDGHLLLNTTGMDRILAFDEVGGRMTVQGGVKIIDIYKRAHHHLLTLAASPTEATITVAGAIAANVNGKDSWRVGNFGEQVRHLKLLTASGETISIDRAEHKELFQAVIGGMGLLGIILEATIQLKRIPSPFLEISRIPVRDLRELFDQMEHLETTSDFAVVWLDSCARGAKLGRGVIHATKWIPRDATADQLREAVSSGFRRLATGRRQALALYGVVDWTISAALQGQTTVVRFFNSLYYVYSRLRRRLGTAGNVELFLRYNFDASFTVPPPATLCGPHGYTIQVSVPRHDAPETITEMIEICQRSPCPSVTTIMRVHKSDDHLISFSEDGYSLNFVFHPKKRHLARMRPFIDALIECVIRHRGKVHLAKDMILTRDQFQRIYPGYGAFLEVKHRLDPDELFASDMYRRLIRVAPTPPARHPPPGVLDVHVSRVSVPPEPAR